MDELAFSLNGENMHYGTPVNPAAPGHIPGGSSSGSAASQAGGTITRRGSEKSMLRFRKEHVNPHCLCMPLVTLRGCHSPSMWNP